MRIADIQKHNITNDELEIIYEWSHALSDFCEMTDGTWGIEWETDMGRYWERFSTKEEAEAALDRESDRQLEMLLEAREELKRRNEAKRIAGNKKAAERRALREAKTLGGQHDVLGQLLVQMREEYASK